jgi:hypothetical protein
MSRLPLIGMLIGGLLLAGCAQHEAARKTSASTTTTSPISTSTTPHTRAAASGSKTTEATTEAKLPEHTGIAACDDYLSSYLACHRAAAIYAPDQLQSRYDAMRTSLLRDSQNPEIRPQLGARCNSLASQLRQALHGKSCAENPAPAGGTP